MKGSALFGILVVSILIMGGSFYYFHAQDQKILPKYSISLDFKDNSSFNASYPITLSGVPSGSGTYQQLITLNDYSKYGINLQGSNIAFYDASNLTHLYAWIQSINTTSMQIWVKNYNASHVIDMQVLPSFENLFRANGYLGEAPQLSTVYGQNDNGQYVFGKTNYTDFLNLSETENFLAMSAVTSSYQFSNGIIFPKGILSTNVNYNTIASNIQYKYGDYLGFSVLGNTSTISYNRIGFGFADYSNNSYWVRMSPTSYFSVYNSGTNIFGSIATPNMTFINGYTAETTAGVPFLYFNGVSVTSGISITAVNHRAFIQLNSGYESFHYMFVASENGQMPTFTIGPAYHPLSSFSISSNSLVVNTTFTEHNLTAYQYYAFSPVYEGNPVWFLVNGQVGDRLSVLLDGNVSLTIQVLGYSYSNVIKEVKVE